MSVELIIAVTVMFVTVIFCAMLVVLQERERREWQRERGQLLNRLMSRDIQEYAFYGAEKAKKKPPPNNFILEEIAKIEAQGRGE